MEQRQGFDAGSTASSAAPWPAVAASPSSTKVVLVTGCTAGGMGHAMSLEFARRGCHVFATARRLDAMAGLEAAGCTLLPLDVTDAASVQACVSAVMRTAGRIDVLINNAGLSGRGPVADYPLEEMRRQFEVNVFGALSLTQAVLPHMLAARSGTVINVGSALGLLSVPFAGAYCASKRALLCLSECMRRELRGSGIYVSYAAPGWVRTNIIGSMASSGANVVDPNGPWGPCARFVTGNLYEVEAGHAWTAEAFAAAFAAMALSRRPPAIWTNSARDGWLAVIVGAVLPTWLADTVLAWRYGIHASLFERHAAAAAAALKGSSACEEGVADDGTVVGRDAQISDCLLRTSSSSKPTTRAAARRATGSSAVL